MRWGWVVTAEEINSDLLDDLINKLKYVGLENIDDINSSLLEFGDIIVSFTSLVAGTGDGEFWELPHGICISNLIYVKVVRNKSPKKYFEFLEKFEIGDKEKWEQEAKFMISNYEQVIANTELKKVEGDETMMMPRNSEDIP